MTQWVWIPGYEGRYQVNRRGDVRSVDIVITDRLGRTRKQKGRNIVHQVDDFGYHRVELNRDGERRAIGVHRLVALAFLPAPLPGQIEVRHRDHDPANNTVENLCWGTHSDNVRDTIRDGRFISANAMKTKCPAGHEYSGRNMRGDRVCHECRRVAQRQYRERQHAQA